MIINNWIENVKEKNRNQEWNIKEASHHAKKHDKRLLEKKYLLL